MRYVDRIEELQVLLKDADYVGVKTVEGDVSPSGVSGGNVHLPPGPHPVFVSGEMLIRPFNWFCVNRLAQAVLARKNVEAIRP